MIRLRFFRWMASIAFCCCAISALGQTTTDSLRQLLQYTTDEDEQLRLLKQLVQENVYATPDTAIIYASKAIQLSEAKQDTASTVYFMGRLAVAELRLSNYTKALDISLQAIQLSDASGNEDLSAYIYNNIGNLYRETGKNDDARFYYKKALDLNIAMQDSIGMSIGYNNLGIMYMIEAKYDTGMAMWQQSLNIKLLINDEVGASSTMNNMAMYYADIGETEKALDFYNQVQAIYKRTENHRGLSIAFDNKGDLYLKQEDFTTALYYLEKSYDEAILSHSKYLQSKALYNLAITHARAGNFEKAYTFHVQHKAVQDSIFNDKNQELIEEMEARFDSEKKELEIARFKEEAIAQAEEDKRRITMIIALAIGLVLMLVLALIIFLNNLRRKRDHHIISFQKQQVEVKNKEILDSINYAKRLQDAFIPSAQQFKAILPHSFVFYRPKDIVAGDFYWLEQKNDVVLFAVADCTGHGVPGAMVSVVCSNALNQAVNALGLTTPAQILDKTRELVIQQFSKSESEVKDGMDISLAAWNRANNTLQWAGAHSPLWIVRQGELLEYKANKQPIGMVDRAAPFTNHTIALQPNDLLYLFSDGFGDQFGGEKGKKFKSVNFKQLLTSIAQQPMPDQLKALQTTFDTWKGPLEQLDDICVIGVKA